MATFSLLFYMHFKNRVKVYLQYTSLLNSWWTQIYLKHTFQLFCNKVSNKVANFDCMFISCHVCIRVNPQSTDAWMPRNSLLEIGVISVSNCNGAGTNNQLVNKHSTIWPNWLSLWRSKSQIVYLKYNSYLDYKSISEVYSDVFKLFGRPVYWFGHPKTCFKLSFFSFIFQQNIHWRND